MKTCKMWTLCDHYIIRKLSVYFYQTNFAENKLWEMVIQIKTLKTKYSRTPMAQTLTLHLPGLASIVVMVPTGNFMHNLPWMAGTTLG